MDRIQSQKILADVKKLITRICVGLVFALAFFSVYCIIRGGIDLAMENIIYQTGLTSIAIFTSIFIYFKVKNIILKAVRIPEFPTGDSR